MKKLHLSKSLLAVAFLALIWDSSHAAPQDNIFSRSGDKKVEALSDDDPDLELGDPEQTTDEDPAETATDSETTGSNEPAKSTARIEGQSDGWFTVADETSQVEVRLPSEPTYQERSWSPISGRKALTNHIYLALANNKQISVDYSWYDIHEAPSTPKEIKATLEGAVKGSVVNVFGELTRMDMAKSGNVPGREFDFKFTIKLPQGKMAAMSGQSQIFLKGKRRYQLTVISHAGKEDKELTQKLFDSLIITE